MEKQGAIETLNRRVRELQMLQARLEDKDNRLREMDTLLQSATMEKQGAVETLNRRVGELEMLQARLEDKDNRLREMDARLTASLREKEMEVQTLRKRVSELELKAGEAEEKDRRISEMGALLASTVREKDGQIRDLETRITEIEPVLEQIEDKDGMLRELDMTLKAVTREKDQQIDALKKRLGETDGRLQKAVADKDAEITALQNRTGELQSSLLEMEGQNRRAQEQEKNRSAAAREKDALIAELKRRILELAPLENRVIEDDRALKAFEARSQGMEAEIGKLRKKIGMSRPSERPRARRTAKTGARDDLKTISGIGPVIERALNRLGVRTYRQIATWTRADIDRVSSILTAFKDRIRRENWVRQAREAHLKKYGKRP